VFLHLSQFDAACTAVRVQIERGEVLEAWRYHIAGASSLTLPLARLA
jgi:hypothetical protein